MPSKHVEKWRTINSLLRHTRSWLNKPAAFADKATTDCEMLKIYPNINELNRFAAQSFVEISNEAIERRGLFTVALAGGSTPKSLYQMLAGDEFKHQIDWSKTFFFFGDERNVPVDSEESNFRMANENLFAPLNIAEEKIIRWIVELEQAEKIAEAYETAFKNFFRIKGNEIPRLDLVLLGMGADGHTASLFPGTKALSEKKRNAVVNPVEKLDTTRLTLTFPVINNSRNVIFLVKGADKAETLRDVLLGDFQPDKFPAQNVKPVNGNLLWLVDQTSARLLKL